MYHEVKDQFEVKPIPGILEAEGFVPKTGNFENIIRDDEQKLEAVV